MTKQQYIRQVGKALQCASAKKGEILRQLDSDIEIGLSEGRELPKILEDMGKPEALAGAFNESLDEEERKRGKRRKRGRRILCILGVVFALLAVLAGAVYWMLPKMRDIEDSKIFDSARVQTCAEEVIRLFGGEEYETLEDYASGEMRRALEEMPFAAIRGLMPGDWGKQINMGNVYMVEIHEKNKVYATAQVTVSYENVNVTYTISFNSQMELYGFYVR